MEVNPNLSDKAKYDLRLVERAIQGEEIAFTELLERYRDTIFFMLLKKVNNEVDAEDLTIESFGKAFSSLHQYTPDFAFSTWLFKIANNNYIDSVRKQNCRVASVDVYIRDEENEIQSIEFPTSLLNPEERLIKEQKAELLKSIVKQLNPLYSDLIKLRYYKEMSYIEIAEELNIPIGTVKARLHRSRELLESMLTLQEKNL